MLLIWFINNENWYKEYIPIALEFKLIDKNLDEKGMKKEVDKLTKEQNVRYAKGAALKAITDSDKMSFMGVVVNVGTQDKGSFILTSDEFVPALVVHSSIHMIHPDTVEQQEEDPRTLESAIGSNDGTRPGNELESPGISNVPRGRGRGNQ